MAGNANSGGHNKKGTQLHVLQGTFRKDRHGDHETPEPPKGVPQPPRLLQATEKAEWNRMVTRLEKARTLSLVDDAALYQYVQLFAETEAIRADHAATRKEKAQLRTLSADLKKTARTLEGEELVAAIAEIVKLQKVMLELGKALTMESTKLRQGHMALRQYLVEFGMTPSARGRVKLPKPQGGGAAGDPTKARFFGGHRNA